MSNKNLTHVGPSGHGKDEEKAQNDFAQALIEAAKQRQAEIEAEQSKRGGKK